MNSGFNYRISAKNAFRDKIITSSWIMLTLSAIYQYLFHETADNMMATGCVILAWAVVSRIFLMGPMLKCYPFSTFIITGFTATQFYFPLIFTSLENKPLIFNLDRPFEVFFHSLLVLTVLITSHTVYRYLAGKPGFKEGGLAERAGLFNPPDPMQLWLMGLTGLAATFYVYLYSPHIGWSVTGSATDKAVQALMPFSYAPYFIPFGRMYGGKEPRLKSILIPLAVFSLLLFMVSIGRNSRGGFMLGFASLGLAWGMGLLLGMFKTGIFTLRNGLMVALVYWLFTGPIADIGTAMVLVRAQRNDISYKELIARTLEAYEDKKAIKLRRLADLQNETDWDETYLDNIIMARFSNLKFNDASLVQAAKTGEHNPAMLSFAIDNLWATLPQPLLTAFGIHIDKIMLKGVSFGDYLYYCAGAPAETLGGYRTGHFAGTGMAAFGWWYLLILGIGIIPVFLLFDKFFIYRKVTLPSDSGPVQVYRLQFSLCGMLALDSAFRFLPPESVTATIVFLMRDWIQLVILYLFIWHITKLLTVCFSWFAPEPKEMTALTTLKTE